MSIIVSGYNFNPNNRQITFPFAPILEQILLITDVTNNITIYQFNNTSLGGSVSGNILTLTYNTNTASFNSTDKLQIVYAGNYLPTGAAQDGNDAIEPIQLPGATGIRGWLSSIYRTLINTLGAAQSPDSPLFVALTGDPSGDFAGTNILEQVATDGTGFAFQVKQLNGPQVDTSNALVFSDAKPIQLPYLNIGSSAIIDTTGYQSLNITTQTLAGSITASNDQQTWSALSGTPLVFGILTSSITASAGFSFPCLARYIRITATTAGSATIYLRAQPWQGAYTTTVPTSTAQDNISQWGGTAVVTGGVAGIPAVGGNIAAGTAPTSNPIPIGSIDTSGLTRRILTDTTGRIIDTTVAPDITNTQRPLTSIVTQANNITSLATQETGLFEGQNQIELLAQILLEIRILNQQIFLLNTQGGSTIADDPQAFRLEQSLFNQ